MTRIPVVGTKQLHTAQLSPGLRRILHHRAAAANRREFAPVLAADRGAFKSANRGYQLQAQSARGATHMVEGALSQALRGLKGSGLKGGYLRQVQHELTSRQADAASSIPMLLADAAQERSSNILDARNQLNTDRASMQSGIASDFNSLLAEERGHASSALKASESATKPSKDDVANLKSASIAFKDALATWEKNIPVKGPDGKEVPVQSLNPLQTPAQWRAFAVGLDKHYSGFNLAEAMKIVNHYIETVIKPKQRKLRQGESVPVHGVFNAG